MEQKKPVERRKFPRIEKEIIVRYKILSTPEEQLDAKTKNISGGGVCLVTREKMNMETVVAMEIRFPQMNKPIVTTARVVWCSESKLGPNPAGHIRFDNGIEFTQISEADREQIIKYVEVELKKEKGGDWKIGLVTNLGK